jgi:hypothetical protein
MFARCVAIAVLCVSLLVGTPEARAEKYVKHVNGREFVVHTNPAPVIVHRILPPFYGKHVTERQMKVGRLPPAARR